MDITKLRSKKSKNLIITIAGPGEANVKTAKDLLDHIIKLAATVTAAVITGMRVVETVKNLLQEFCRWLQDIWGSIMEWCYGNTEEQKKQAVVYSNAKWA